MTPFRCPSTLILASCLFLLLLLLQEGSCGPHCTVYDQAAPENCKYGITKDWCHNYVCAKGPGETCGGHRKAEGTCGEGTDCGDCGRCIGCTPFDNNECYPPPGKQLPLVC